MLSSLGFLNFAKSAFSLFLTSSFSNKVYATDINIPEASARYGIIIGAGIPLDFYGYQITPELVTAKVGTSLTEAKKILFKNKIEKLIIVDNNFKCKGLITVKDIQKSQIYPEAAKDKKGSLIVAAAVGTGPESFQRAEQDRKSVV